MPYTLHDTPRLVARIERDLSTVLAAVRDADPHARSLVLTGGFARGEGAARDGVPQNDYDLIAVRGLGPTRTPYARVRAVLKDRLRLHIDLAPIASWRLPWVSPSIFWYETAARGRVLWGPNLLGRIPVRTPRDLDPAEGLRLLVNRAAGLLLVTDDPDAEAHRLQAAKALLAALDARLLARGEFPPSQRERWARFEAMRARGTAPAELARLQAWLAWAYRFKVDPASASPRRADEAWRTAAQAILDAVPVALGHARLASLEAYARRDGVLDRLVYLRRAARIPNVRRWVPHPTGRVRVATLRLLEASLDGRVRPEAARRCLGDLAREADRPLPLLDALRRATLQ